MFIKGQFLYPSQKGDFTKEIFSSLITFPLKKADQRFRQFLFFSAIVTDYNLQKQN